VSAHRVHVTVNGERTEREVEARRRLADFLREDLGLYGTKVSCEVQVCGACTVLVDGQPVSSCTYLAVDVDGRSVTTVEGVGKREQLSPVQQAFVDHAAVQCGFCTPGFVLATTALLAESPQPSEEEIREYLDGNICRCTGYAQILRAVQQAAGTAVQGGSHA
jgi:carbon-monoxide dehydrogenase small subunit